MSSRYTQVSSDHPASLSVPPQVTSNTVLGLDVGGTNTDAVILRNETILACHKTPTTADIQRGVEIAIEKVVKKAGLSSDQIDSIKIGTTQFMNAILEQDSSKLDKVGVIRLCGPYTRASPSFIGFPAKLRKLTEGHVSYVDGGYEVHGTEIVPLNQSQLIREASVIKDKNIKSIVIIGVYSPSNPSQEERARNILQLALGSDYDITCSSAIGRLGFLERENASILNASLRRFARHVIAGFSRAACKLGKCRLYITQNDGTLSKASAAAEYPIRCFSSGPTNSARGAALLVQAEPGLFDDEKELLVVDVGGTTTDICTLLPSGYPRQSAAFVKISGVRTNFTMPDVHSIALGGGSLVRTSGARASVGPDSVGSQLEEMSIAFGGSNLTTTDLVTNNHLTNQAVSLEIRDAGLQEIARILEEAIDLVKTKQGDSRVILVGGGNIIIGNHVAGVGQIIRPNYLEVANAIGAAVAQICGIVDRTVVPSSATIAEEIENAKSLAIERCVAAGGDQNTIEVTEIDMIPLSYVTNGASRIIVKVIGNLMERGEELHELLEGVQSSDYVSSMCEEAVPVDVPLTKASSYDIVVPIDLETYKPRIEGDFWYLSELDLNFLLDGTGVLAVGSCGEPYSAYLACLMALRSGEEITIRRQDTFPDDSVALVAGFMGSPSVYFERLPGLTEISDAMAAVMKAKGLSDLHAIIAHEIGGINAMVALLTATRFKKSVLDTDLVGRAYPFLWQTIRCLNDVPITPAAVTNGLGSSATFETTKDYLEAEKLMRDATCTRLGSLAGFSINPVHGKEGRTLPKNSFSHAWRIGRSIALARSRKQDPVAFILESHSGNLLFTGKIISVTRKVTSGFTRGSVLLQSSSDQSISSLFVEFENENLSAVLKRRGEDDKLLAVCPDLITFLDIANGAPLGIDDYKYGLRVSVIALSPPPAWTTDRGLQLGGPKAFELDAEYSKGGDREYEAPKSLWEEFGGG